MGPQSPSDEVALAAGPVIVKTLEFCFLVSFLLWTNLSASPSCLKNGDTCDYRIRLNWEGRRIKRRTGSDDADESLPSPILFSNEFLVDSSAADTIGVPLQRYATEPSSTNTGPIHYEFEHTLFQDLHRGHDAGLPAVVKKKAKSMDDCFSSDRSPADIRLDINRRNFGQNTISPQSNAAGQSPASTISTIEEAVTSRSVQTDAQMEPYYLDQAHSPSELQWSGGWGNVRASLDYMAVSSPQLSKMATCTSDEMAVKSTWVNPSTVETSDRRSSVDEAGADSVECPARFSHPTQVSYSSAPACNMVWQTSGKPWAMLGDINSTLNGIGSFDTTAGQAATVLQSPLWIPSGGYPQTADSVPKGITPVPDKLKDETNMMEHFVNHTAKVMAPYHSKQANPFSSFLPGIAFQSDILLSLMLAFSGIQKQALHHKHKLTPTVAAHRSQVLRMTEPELRIAEWADDIFPALRLKLSDSSKAVPNDILLSMVLLTSLEKSSPNAFGHSIPWQKHLSLTRSLMDKRLGDHYVQDETDEEFSFIWSWFSYLDTMGQISAGPSIRGLPYQTGPFNLIQRMTVEDEDEFDCSMGFTTRCGQLLIELASHIRRRSTADDEDEEMLQAALDLEDRFKESMTRPVKVCRHLRRNKIEMRSLTEMDAASQAFHWAGIVCLRRRILGRDSGDEEVQDGVQRIWECIQHIRREKEADTACVFPLFIAGCETNEVAQRKMILARLKSAEKSGMRQVKRARKLMEASWREEQPWFDLLQDEFLG
ncbi:hypothetical protein NLG97_g2628 [Lecanicillium saksenae]|uniref:Uncharacterized protein n=1 Tax=Lecanicillium saksenae TaxID=468837 RepID=A0ACC1R122_9HYPO|nr:hypothetical protein NLG97_g2628 [Lecanicillium saksenae]